MNLAVEEDFVTVVILVFNLILVTFFFPLTSYRWHPPPSGLKGPDLSIDLNLLDKKNKTDSWHLLKSAPTNGFFWIYFKDGQGNSAAPLSSAPMSVLASFSIFCCCFSLSCNLFTSNFTGLLLFISFPQKRQRKLEASKCNICNNIIIVHVVFPSCDLQRVKTPESSRSSVKLNTRAGWRRFSESVGSDGATQEMPPKLIMDRKSQSLMSTLTSEAVVVNE